jgi:electron transport complex protein RnfA
MKYLILLLSSAFINNVVLTQLLGIAPMMTGTRKVDSALKLSLVVAIVLILSTITNYLIEEYILYPFQIQYLQILFFVLIVLIIGHLVQIVLIKIPGLIEQFEENFFVLLVSNSTILGTSLIVIKKHVNFLESAVIGLGSALGYVLIMIIFAAIQEQLRLEPLPKNMQGYPILLIIAGILAMAFIGFK